MSVHDFYVGVRSSLPCTVKDIPITYIPVGQAVKASWLLYSKYVGLLLRTALLLF